MCTHRSVNFKEAVMESCPALDCVIFNAEPSAWTPTNSHCSALPEAFWILHYCALHTTSTPSRSLYIPLSHGSGFSPTGPLFFEDRHHFPYCKSSSYCIDRDSQQRASCHSLRKPQTRFSVLRKNTKIAPGSCLSMELEKKQTYTLSAHRPRHCGLSAGRWNDALSRETTEWAYLLFILILGFILGLDKFLHCQVKVEGAGSMQRFTISSLS